LAKQEGRRKAPTGRTRCLRKSGPKLERDHIHMACLRRCQITEFVSDSFERLKRQVEKDCRFRVLISRLEMGGYCAACRGSK